MSNQQIKKGAIISYIAIFVNIAAGLLYTPWMISQIGKADYGLYILMSSILTYFTVDYGLSQAVTRLLAKYKTENKTEKFNNLLAVSAKLYLVLDIFVIIALIVFYFFIDKVFVELSAIEILKFKKIYVIAAVFSVFSFPMLYISGVYYACEFFLQVKLFELITKLGAIFLTVLILLLGYGLTALVFVFAAVPFVVNVSKIIYLKQKGYLTINWKFWDNEVLKGILGTSLWLLIILIGELFLKNISPTILGAFSGSEEIAVFSIANTLDNYILTFAIALNGLFLPKISGYLNQPNKEMLVENLMIKVGRFQVMLVGLICLALVLVGKDFIYLWLGGHFAKSYYVLILLVLPNFLYSIIQLGATYMLAIDNLKYLALIYVFAAITNVILSIIFSPQYGAIGSGISIFISKMFFYIIGFTYVYHKILKINMINFYKNTVGGFFFPLVFIVLLFIAFDYFTMSEICILSFTINCIVLFLLFTVFIFRYYLIQSEKEIVWAFLRKITKR